MLPPGPAFAGVPEVVTFTWNCVAFKTDVTWNFLPSKSDVE